MYELPVTVLIKDRQYKIRNNADFRTILDVIVTCEDNTLTPEERGVIALIIFYEDINSIDDIFTEFEDCLEEAKDKMMEFIACSEDLGYKAKSKLIDWKQDEQLIVSAVNHVAQTEIRALAYLHWWTFLSYYMAVGECSLSTVVGIRDKINRGKKLEKYELEFRRDNPQYFIWKNQQQESQELLSSIWNQEVKK